MLKIKFEKPPLYTTSTGALVVKSEDIIRSKAGQELILRFLPAKLAP